MHLLLLLACRSEPVKPPSDTGTPTSDPDPTTPETETTPTELAPILGDWEGGCVVASGAPTLDYDPSGFEISADRGDLYAWLVSGVDLTSREPLVFSFDGVHAVFEGTRYEDTCCYESPYHGEADLAGDVLSGTLTLTDGSGVLACTWQRGP